MPIITLTTDMGDKDYYLSAIKGNILMQLPEATIVDITHQIKPWDIIQAAFVIKNAYINFPIGSIHIIGVDTECYDGRKHIAVKYNDHYFIGTDNGIFSLILEKKPDVQVELNLIKDANLTFPTKDVFVKAACHIARGGTLEVLGRSIDHLKSVSIGYPATDENMIVGKIIYIDHYENVITNINHETFKRIGKGRPFRMLISRDEYFIEKLSSRYSDADISDIVVLINELGFIEVALNQGNAAGLLGLKIDGQLRFYFE